MSRTNQILFEIPVGRYQNQLMCVPPEFRSFVLEAAIMLSVYHLNPYTNSQCTEYIDYTLNDKLDKYDSGYLGQMWVKYIPNLYTFPLSEYRIVVSDECMKVICDVFTEIEDLFACISREVYDMTCFIIYNLDIVTGRILVEYGEYM